MHNRIYILSGGAPLLWGLLLKRKGETMEILFGVLLVLALGIVGKAAESRASCERRDNILREMRERRK
jgi:hypothetical protein